MNKYTFDIHAREIGAIGIWQNFTVSVVAENQEKAELRLYDTHDHIHGKKLVKTEEVNSD